MLETISYELLKSIMALLVIIDPLGNIPIFMTMTEKMNRRERKKVFNLASITAFILLLIFAMIGHSLLRLFGISLYSFMIAGGILLLIIAIKILIYGGWREKGLSSESVGIVPIAFPLLVGPGAITTTMVLLQTSGFYITIIAVLTVFMLVWISLNLIDKIYNLLGKTGSDVIARIMAVFIAAIAIEFIINGIKQSF
ncbi:MAG: MarC family protein [Candidatus Bathyarchaeia archaeon]